MASRSGFRAANAKHIQGEVVDSVDAESLFLLASGRVDFGKGAELNVRHWSNCKALSCYNYDISYRMNSVPGSVNKASNIPIANPGKKLINMNFR